MLRITHDTPIPNTFHIPAKAATFVTYGREDTEELTTFLQGEGKGRRILNIGQGSNLLFLKDFDGIVLSSEVRDFSVSGNRLRVGAAWVVDELIERTLALGLYGLENLSLIPGTVGAAAVQNIGAYGVEIANFIREVEALELETGTIRIFRPEELHYGYRRSFFKAPEEWGRWAVLSVTLELSHDFVPRLDYGGLRQRLGEGSVSARQVREAVIAIRREKLPDPQVLGNAGSFFVNPVVPREKADELRRQYPDMPTYEAEGGVKIPAGWMIEQCGWKGRALGPAAVHDRQALVLVNRGGATGEDISRLSEAVRAAVKERFGVDVRPEVNFL